MAKIESSNRAGVFVQLDDADAFFLRNRRLRIDNNGYALVVIGKKSVVALHVLLTPINSTRKRLLVDHINRDRLDNRRSNLRITDAAGNAANHTPRLNGKFKEGIRLTSAGRWNARHGANGKNIGTYDTLEQAVEARERFMRARYKEFYNGSPPPLDDSGQG